MSSPTVTRRGAPPGPERSQTRSYTEFYGISRVCQGAESLFPLPAFPSPKGGKSIRAIASSADLPPPGSIPKPRCTGLEDGTPVPERVPPSCEARGCRPKAPPVSKKYRTAGLRRQKRDGHRNFYGPFPSARLQRECAYHLMRPSSRKTPAIESTNMETSSGSRPSVSRRSGRLPATSHRARESPGSPRPSITLYARRPSLFAGFPKK